MNLDLVELILAEWDASRDRSVSPELQAVDAALFLEDTFGVVVPEDAIDPEVLGTLDGARGVLERLRAF